MGNDERKVPHTLRIMEAKDAELKTKRALPAPNVMILHAQFMIYAGPRLAALGNWLMNTLLSQSREKAADGNVRATLHLSSPQRAGPAEAPWCRAQGTRAGETPRRSSTHWALEDGQLTIHTQNESLLCPNGASGCDTTTGANMKEFWTKASLLLLLDCLKYCVCIFWGKAPSQKMETTSIHPNF